MLLVALSAFCLLGAEASLSHKEKIMQKMHKVNMLNVCYGDKAMKEFTVGLYEATEFCKEIQTPGHMMDMGDYSNMNDQVEALQRLLSNPLVAALLKPQSSFRRLRRQALEVSTEDQMEFQDNIAELKMDMHTMLGNLSCVMMQMKMLDAAGNINMESYSLNSIKEHFRNTPAGSDPLYLEKMANGMTDCYDVSRAWPQTSLDRNPILKEHGRHMIFFQCADKVETGLCSQYQMLQWLIDYFGMDDIEAKFGNKLDKYDAAEMAIYAMYNGASKEMVFVDDFFFQSRDLM